MTEWEGRPRFPDRLAVDLACDANLNIVWKSERDNARTTHKPPRERITVEEAEIAQTRPIEPEDFIGPFKN